MADDAALDTTALEALLGWQLSLANVPARRVFQQHVGEPFELRPVEYSLLVLLRANPGTAPKQMAQVLQLPPPAVTLLVDRLAARGLVARHKSRTDGRGQELHLTDKGQLLADRAQAAARTMEDGLLARLSPAERAMLRELLLKLARGGAAA